MKLVLFTHHYRHFEVHPRCHGDPAGSDAMKTTKGPYAWVNRTLFVGSGSLLADKVVMSLFAIR